MIVCNVQELGDRDTVTVLSLPPKMCNYLLHIPGPGLVQDQGRTGASTVSCVPSSSVARIVQF